MNSPAIMARRSYLRARCNLVIVHSYRVERRIDEYRWIISIGRCNGAIFHVMSEEF